MIFHNASRYPDDELRQLILIGAADVDLARVGVVVRDAAWWAHSGRAHWRVPRRSPLAGDYRALHQLTLYIGPPEKFPADNLVTTLRWLPLGTTLAEAEQKAARRPGDEAVSRWVSTGWRMESAQQFGIKRRHPYGGLRAPLIEMADWREGVVAIAAHEAHHIAIFREQGRHIEADCERAAARALDRYRALLRDAA